MTTAHTAAAELADALEQENAALLRLDLPAVTAMLATKKRALEAFQMAARRTAMTTETDRPMHSLALRLQEAAAENKRLLERAMTAQQYIMSLLARAARQAVPGNLYGARGAYVGRADGAFALLAQA